MELHTPRLLLRDFTDADFAAVHAYGSDERAVHFMDWGPNTPDESRAFLARKLAAQQVVPRQEYELAIVIRETGRVIGGAGIRLDATRKGSADMGYVYHPDVWGRGYATEAAAALVAFGFDQLKLHRIYATCDPENRASARVMEKIGMRYEGRIRHHLFQKGQWRDSLLYAVLECDPRS
jgi:ribosomal-protein-alanine N-acetyltransferase